MLLSVPRLDCDANTWCSLGPNLVRVVPSTCVTFLVYENTKFYMPRLWDSDEDDVAEVAQ